MSGRSDRILRMGLAGACGVAARWRVRKTERRSTPVSRTSTRCRRASGSAPVARDAAFEHVYQSPLDPNQRYRVAGGLYAVFDVSEYVEARRLASLPYGRAVPSVRRWASVTVRSIPRQPRAEADEP